MLKLTEEEISTIFKNLERSINCLEDGVLLGSDETIDLLALGSCIGQAIAMLKHAKAVIIDKAPIDEQPDK